MTRNVQWSPLWLLFWLAVRDSTAIRMNLISESWDELKGRSLSKEVAEQAHGMEQSTQVEITGPLMRALHYTLNGAEIVQPAAFSGKIVVTVLSQPPNGMRPVYIRCAEIVRPHNGVGLGLIGLDLQLRVDLQGVQYDSGIPLCCWMDGYADIHVNWPQLRMGLIKRWPSTEYRGEANQLDAKDWTIEFLAWKGRTGALSRGGGFAFDLVQHPLNALLSSLLPELVVKKIAATTDQYSSVPGIQTIVSVLSSQWTHDLNSTACKYLYEYQRGERGVPVDDDGFPLQTSTSGQ